MSRKPRMKPLTMSSDDLLRLLNRTCGDLENGRTREGAITWEAVPRSPGEYRVLAAIRRGFAVTLIRDYPDGDDAAS